MNAVTVEQVGALPGAVRFRLVGDLDDAAVGRVAMSLRPALQLPGDLLLDLRDLSCADGSVVLLFYDLAAQLGGKGRLYLLFPKASVRRLVEAFGLEEELLNLRLIRHPARQGSSQAPPAALHNPAADAVPGEDRTRFPVVRRIPRPRALPRPSRALARPRRVHRLALRWQPE